MRYRTRLVVLSLGLLAGVLFALLFSKTTGSEVSVSDEGPLDQMDRSGAAGAESTSEKPRGKRAPPRFNVPPTVPRILTAAELFMKQPRPFDTFYNEEDRDPAWAPQMESRLQARLSAAAFESVGLEGLNMSHVDCKKTTCRVELQYSHELRDKVSERAFADGFSRETDPIGYYEMQTGNIATVGGSTRVDEVTKDGVKYLRKTVFIGFGSGAMDPTRYPKWSESKKAQAEELRERFRLVEQMRREKEAQKTAVQSAAAKLSL